MIAFLCGTVQKRLPEGVILNVQGVGYHLFLPLGAIAALPLAGEELSLWVYTKVREDALQLFGFQSFSERQLFVLLIDINGVGPKVALAILSSMGSDQLRSIVERQQAEMLQVVPGVGKRLADKLLLELQARLDKFPALEPSATASAGRQPFLHEQLTGAKKTLQLAVETQQDLHSALENLGYRDKDITPVVQRLRQEYTGEELPQLLRRALLVIGQSKNFKKGESEILF